MAYEEPGVKVVQQLVQQQVNIQGGAQVLTITGPLYEVFDDQVHDESYDALTGAGDQEFPWPGKKSTSVVDLDGVRKAIAEPDSQLLERAEYPLRLQLRDPETSAVFDVDTLTDVFAVTQSGFRIKEASKAATAKISGDAGTAARPGRLHVRAGGLVSADVSVGDRIRLTNSPNSPLFDVRASVTSFTDDDLSYVADGTVGQVQVDAAAGALTLVVSVAAPATLPASGTMIVGSGSNTELVSYNALVVSGSVHTFTVSALALAHDAGESVLVQIADAADISGLDGDLRTTGDLISSDENLSGKSGSRLAIWLEQMEVSDGVSAGGTAIETTSLTLDSVYVGRKVSIGVAGAEVLDGDLDTVANQLSSASATFAADDLGKVIKIGSAYRRITAVNSVTVITYSGSALTGTGVTYRVYDLVTRTITSVSGSDFTVDSSVTAGTDLPVILRRPVYRDVEVVVTGSGPAQVTYSGSGLSSDTGFLTRVPFEVYDEVVSFEVFPRYELLVTYRALDVVNVDRVLTVYAPSDLTAMGSVSKANPLLWAAQTALVAMGTEDTPVFLMPVDLFAGEVERTGYPEDQNEALGYLLGLEVLSSTPAAYYLVPLTRNTTVRDAFDAHVGSMSLPELKNERVCYLTYSLPLGEIESTTGIIAPGLDAGNKVINDPGRGFVSVGGVIPGKEVVVLAPAEFAGRYVAAAGTDDDNLVLGGANWLQDGAGVFLPGAGEFTVSDADTTVAGEITSVSAAAWKDVEAGDYVLMGSVTRKISAVTSGPGGLYTKLEYAGAALSSGTDQTVSILRTHVGVEFYASPLDKDQQADALAGISQSRGDRRVIHVWPDVAEQITGTDSFGNEVREFLPSYYKAVAEAGRDSVLRPERSSTGSALAGFTDLRHSNRYFKTSQLNKIAGAGWTVFTQPQVGGPIVCRHLLSTDMSSVKTQELSFTKNVDNMAKVKRASLEPLLNDDRGRVNITQDFLTAMAFPVQGIYERFAANEQLVKTASADPYKIISIRQDPNAPDTILEDAELNVPVPANKVTVTFVI
jgi:hypothetical protein